MTPIPLSRPSLTPHDEEAVLAVMRSGWLVQGRCVEAFERALADLCGRKHAVMVTNGTSALHLALQVLGVAAGDEVVCPALTWPSPAHVVALLGARPVLAEVDAGTWNLNPETLREALTPKTRVVIAIDQFGVPVCPAGLQEALAASGSSAILVEDAACAIGSRFGVGAGPLAGSSCGQLGRISCMSFHPRKILTTGEGGACLTDDDDLAARLRVLRNHGQSAPGVFPEPGGNFRMPEMSAAMGLSQLARLPSTLTRLREIDARYRARLGDWLQFQRVPQGAMHNGQTVGALVPDAFGEAGRDRLIREASAEGVQLGRLSYALHRLPSMQHARRRSSPYTTTEAVVDRGLALPCFAALREDEQERVIEVCQGLRDAWTGRSA